MDFRPRLTFVSLISLIAMLAGGGSAAARQGDVDPSFGVGGRAEISFGPKSTDAADAVRLQRDGKIVVGGITNRDGTHDFAVARIRNPQGDLDPTFGTGGLFVGDFGTRSDDIANAMAMQRDGELVSAGYTNSAGGFHFALTRITNPGGVFDSTFNGRGKLLLDFGTGSDQATDVAVQSDQKIVVAGYTQNAQNHFAVARVLPGGSLDPDFGNGGQKIVGFGPATTEFANAVTVARDGRILVAGETNAGGHFDFGVARLRTNGALDSGFGAAGLVHFNFGSRRSDAGRQDIDEAVAVQPDRKVVVAGYSTGSHGSKFAIARLDRHGHLDDGFGKHGRTLVGFAPGSEATAYAVALQPDHKIVVAGTTDFKTGDFAVVRLLRNGKLDRSFGRRGKAKVDLGGSPDVAADLAFQRNGKLIVVGTSNALTAVARFGVVRLQGDRCAFTRHKGKRCRK